MILIIAIGLIFLHAISKGICDRIKFKANFKSDWMLGIGEHIWYKRTWLLKVPFSFLSDGWHFFDMLRVVSLCIALTLLVSLDWYAVIIFYIVHGIIFEIIYNS